ncbi:MAG: phosphonoacetate hydrolase [Alphaproteobacteria bacterium]|nr:phosphonoacetate hydrolase [Alphaproteobacteria bacterium]
MSTKRAPVTVNGRRYAWPQQSLVVVCIDGSEPAYITEAVKAGAMPYAQGMLRRGTDRLAHCVVPSFTNPNNLSIVTGVPPAVHGICGNYFYDRESNAEVMMNDPKYLRCGTILAEFARNGARLAVVTAKDKLRKLLGNGMTGICFSSEKADSTTVAEHGIDNALAFVGRPLPSVYSADLSEFVFAAGVKLMATRRPDIMYLSTTDYVQHKHAPGSAEANAFYGMMDGYWAKLEALGCTIALTADHGMNAKTDGAGKPKVVYLQDLYDEWLGVGTARVILPITDPYVVHHGALGSFATAYIPDAVDPGWLSRRTALLPTVETVLTRSEACERFGLPSDRVGDLVIVTKKDSVVGTSASKHDLSGLDAPLRSHGGISEQRVPLIVNRPTSNIAPDAPLRNFDIFDVALNHVH